MKINYIRIENFGGIRQLEISAGGNSVTISGENGAGKSTVANAVAWLFTGKMFDGTKREASPIKSGKYLYEENTVVEVQFMDGQTLRREQNGKTAFFVNGLQIKTQKEFDGYVFGLTKGVMDSCMFPFGFFRKNVDERRKIILPLAGEIDDAEFMPADALEKLHGFLDRMTPATFAKYARDEIRKLTARVKNIPAQVEENQLSIVDEKKLQEEIDGYSATISELQKQIGETRKKENDLRAAVKAQKNPYAEKINALVKQKIALEEEIYKTKTGIETKTTEKNGLAQEYRKILKLFEDGVCPTCGREFTGAKPNRSSVPRVGELIDAGKALAAEIQKLQKRLAELEKKPPELQKQIDELKEEYEPARDDSLAKQTREIQRQVDELHWKICEVDGNRAKTQYRLDENKKCRARINDLIAEEKAHNAQIARLEGQLAMVEDYTDREIKFIEDRINAQFEFVNFRMFTPYKTADGEKPDCEPLLNGVPFADLSKGEKFKVMLDILRTLQKFHGVELPIFIDDAESYTSNSILNLPNQVFWLKVVEGIKELKIVVEEPRKEVAA